MSAAQRGTSPSDIAASGFGVVDDKGRLSLTRVVRHELGIEPGSRVAYILLGGALLIVPEDKHLETLMHKGQEALASAGLTAQDLLDELPAARDAVITETYGADFTKEIARLRVGQQTDTPNA